MSIGDHLISIFTITGIILSAGYMVRLVSRNKLDAKDGPDLLYSIFTDEYDQVCRGEELDAVLESYAANRAPCAAKTAETAEERLRVAERYRSKNLCPVQSFETGELSDTSILILLDQSGSMVDRLPKLLGELVAGLVSFEQAGARTALFGFTTVGWHGGQSRHKWLTNGQKRYPGRLCDLLHIIYNDFDEVADELDLAPLAPRNILFENVDGEALLWARGMLLNEETKKRILVVLSDGAPVDDATLSANGPKFLWRHLEQVLTELEGDDRFSLGAIGIDHRVDNLYRFNEYLSDDDSLTERLIALVDKMLAPSRSE